MRAITSICCAQECFSLAFCIMWFNQIKWYGCQASVVLRIPEVQAETVHLSWNICLRSSTFDTSVSVECLFFHNKVDVFFSSLAQSSIRLFYLVSRCLVFNCIVIISVLTITIPRRVGTQKTASHPKYQATTTKN